MPAAHKEAKNLTAERTRKEKALASMRELELLELQGRLVRADVMEEAWTKAMLQIRDAIMRIPSRCAPRFADRKSAERIIRHECEVALRSLQGDQDNAA